MADESALATAAERAASGAIRIGQAWRRLSADCRLAAYASIGLFVSLLFPWYQDTVIASNKATQLQSASVSITGWGAFSFVEAVIVLVTAGVLTVLFLRAEGRELHLPGGDGATIAASGLLTCALIVWRIFDKQGTTIRGPGATASGIEWGIIVALAFAALLSYAGSRIRSADAARAAQVRASDSRLRREPRAERPVRAPRPVSAQEPATPVVRRAADGSPRSSRADEQLTIPFERGAEQ